MLVRRTVRADGLRPGDLVRNSWREFVRVTSVRVSGGSVWITTAERFGLARLDPDEEIEVVVDEKLTAGC